MVHIDVLVQHITRVSGIEDSSSGGYVDVIEILPQKAQQYGYRYHDAKTIVMYVTVPMLLRGNTNAIIKKACTTYPKSHIAYRSKYVLGEYKESKKRWKLNRSMKRSKNNGKLLRRRRSR